jgi:hypothetical protein
MLLAAEQKYDTSTWYLLGAGYLTPAVLHPSRITLTRSSKACTLTPRRAERETAGDGTDSEIRSPTARVRMRARAYNYARTPHTHAAAAGTDSDDTHLSKRYCKI